MSEMSRRDLLLGAAGMAAASALPRASRVSTRAGAKARLRFAVIGIDHAHIHGQVDAVRRGGGEFVAFHAADDALAAEFAKSHPNVPRVREEREILEDSSIQLILTSIVPAERAPLGIRAMRHGKDVMSDKPGATTLEQLAELRRVQRETGRIYSILYSERLESRATVRASELVRAGAIGEVVQTIGTGPHRIHPPVRPDWFWVRERYGGILCDIGSHQFDQFLHFTGASKVDIVAAEVRNVHHADRPGFQDFGNVTLRSDRGSGYIRLDWFTPAGLPTWGDGRLTILGTDGYMELRKYVDIAGRPGGDHLFIVDAKGVRYEDCHSVDLPYGRQLVDDVLARTETAMTQAHCFMAMELALRAQQLAES